MSDMTITHTLDALTQAMDGLRGTVLAGVLARPTVEALQVHESVQVLGHLRILEWYAVQAAADEDAAALAEVVALFRVLEAAVTAGQAEDTGGETETMPG